jgi:4-amino-4-deoxy-L-arabinose transferase-like glycosyltransferase
MKATKLIYDIKFWLFLFFVLRLIGITNPPLEISHNWRQTTVTMVARNFLETDAAILYPRIDIAGEKTGITGMEFPILNYLIFLVSKLFGYAHWYGRLINLFVSTLGIFYFYKLIAKHFNQKLAFNAAFLLIFSVWFNYSRKIMPDTFSVSLVMMGIFYGSEYLTNKGALKNLGLFFLFVTAGILSKLPSAYLLVVFALLLSDVGIPLRRKLVFSAVSLAGGAICSVYYFYWVPYLTTHFGFAHFFMGKSMLKGFADIASHIDQAFEKFYLEALQIIGFVLFCAGVFFAAKKKEKQLLLIFSVLTAAFIVIMFKSGFAFYHHSYYIIPFAPIMALMAAYGVEQIQSPKLVWTILLLIAGENILNKFIDYTIKPEHMAIVQLEQDLNTLGHQSALIAINSGNVPTPMYFAHRKGWVTTNQQLLDTAGVGRMRLKGLKFIVVLKRAFGAEVKLNYTPVFDSRDYCIYKI